MSSFLSSYDGSLSSSLRSRSQHSNTLSNVSSDSQQQSSEEGQKSEKEDEKDQDEQELDEEEEEPEEEEESQILVHFKSKGSQQSLPAPLEVSRIHLAIQRCRSSVQSLIASFSSSAVFKL